MKRVIIYHDDADGRCAAAIAGRAAPLGMFGGGGGDRQRVEPHYIPMQYGDDTPWFIFAEEAEWAPGEDELWIVDFSFAADVMAKLRDLCGANFVWIDHHETAIEALGAFRYTTGARSKDTAACMLTWRFVHTAPPPKPVVLIADRDVWRFEHGDATRWFYEYYLTQVDDKSPGAEVWDRWLYGGADMAHYLTVGRRLYKARLRGLEAAANRLGRPERIAGTEATMLTLNYPGSGDLGQVVKDLGFDVAHCYVEEHKGGRLVRTHSLYSDTVDVGALAAERGGGGHRGAAGWVEEVA